MPFPAAAGYARAKVPPEEAQISVLASRETDVRRIGTGRRSRIDLGGDVYSAVPLGRLEFHLNICFIPTRPSPGALTGIKLRRVLIGSRPDGSAEAQICSRQRFGPISAAPFDIPTATADS